MPWWGWVVIGAMLLGAELFLVEADFYLVFLGVSAALTGVAALFLPTWAQWLVFAALALTSMTSFRRRLYRYLRREPADFHDSLVGRTVRVTQALPPGESCRIEHQGSTWTVRNEGATAIAADGKAVVTGIDGVVLTIKPAE